MICYIYTHVHTLVCTTFNASSKQATLQHEARQVHNKQINTNQDNTFLKKGAALGGTRTHYTLLTRQSGLPTELPGKLSRQGSKSTIQHNTRQTQYSVLWHHLINPRRACARVTVLVLCVCLCVCVSVYPSVPALAASASVGTSKQRYSRVSLRLFLD